MYKSFFGFQQAPFDKGIDSSMLFQSEAYKEVLARLDYLKTTKGFGLITGDPGVGKTSTLRVYADSLNPSLYKVMYFPMSSGTTMDFYRGLAFSLGEQPKFRKVELFFQIQNAITDLYDKRRITPVFILDEMQSASAQFLHDLSIIFNFDMDKRNPFILILTGLPTLANRLALNQNRSLDQRLVTRFHFSPLTPDEVRDYIKHRFKHAGVSRNLINENAYEAISSSTGGYPRLVGNLVTQCLILAFQKQTELIDEEIVFAASAEAGI